jgi:hypothetical protein
MSDITNRNKTYIMNDKSLLKNVECNKNIYVDNIITYIATDTIHKCNISSCLLCRFYLRHKLYKIGIRAMMYNECMNMLKQRVPNDIVQIILAKSFSK